MKKIKFIIPLLVIMGIVSCNGNENLTTTQLPTTSSVSPTTPNDTRTDIEKLHDFIVNLKTNVNYTMSLTDSDGEWSRKYLPNAYYYYSPDTYADIDNIGYAENETGIFAYKHDKTKVTPVSSYYKDEEGNYLKDLYNTKTLVSSWDIRPVNFANSFALFNIDSLNSATPSAAAPGMFEIDSKEVIPLLPQMHQQNYYDLSQVRARLGVKSYGLLIEFKGQYIDYELKVIDVGSTSIPLISEYLASGQGPTEIVEELTDEDKLKSLLDGLNYVVHNGDYLSYLVTPEYVLVSETDPTTSVVTQYGYLKIKSNNNISAKAGIYKFTIDESNQLVLGKKDFYSEIQDTYYAIPSSIFDDCSWSDRDYIYTCENSMTLLNFTPYMNEEILNQEQYIGKLYISYSLFEGTESYNTSISMVGDHYNYNGNTPTGESTTLIINNFNASENDELGATVINYLNSIHTN